MQKLSCILRYAVHTSNLKRVSQGGSMTDVAFSLLEYDGFGASSKELVEGTATIHSMDRHGVVVPSPKPAPVSILHSCTFPSAF